MTILELPGAEDLTFFHFSYFFRRVARVLALFVLVDDPFSYIKSRLLSRPGSLTYSKFWRISEGAHPLSSREGPQFQFRKRATSLTISKHTELDAAQFIRTAWLWPVERDSGVGIAVVESCLRSYVSFRFVFVFGRDSTVVDDNTGTSQVLKTSLRFVIAV